MTDADGESRLLHLYGEALELGGEELDGFLAQHCAGDPELRSQLTELLEAARGEPVPSCAIP